MSSTSSNYTAGIYQKPLDELLDEVEKGIPESLIPAEIFNDDQVFKAEMERIFTRTWVFVAHESEIPNAGDFVQRRIGLDPVIVTRDGKGGLNVLSNYCRHRGSQVCQTDSGNSRFFQCPYHGWTYSNDGTLVGTPLMRHAYGERLDPNDWSLKRAPKVDSVHGFIFASLSDDVPPLAEWLGGAGWMLNLIVGLHPDGMRVAGPPDRYFINGDWKTAAENFAGDIYHLPTLHFSIQEVNLAQGIQGVCEIGRTYEFENGHNFTGHAWTKAIAPTWVAWGYPPDVLAHLELDKLDEAERFVVDHEPPTVGTIFPNLSFIRTFQVVPDLAGGFPGAVATGFRQWQPVAPGKIELWNWQFVWNFQDEQSVRNAYIAGQYTFGSAGIFEQDDTVAWEGVQRAAASPWMRKEGMKFHYRQHHNPHSPVNHDPDPDWKGPGIHRNTAYGEHPQINFYRQWLRMMKDTSEGKRS